MSPLPRFAGSMEEVPLVPLPAGSRLRIRSQWSRHMSATSQSYSSRKRRRTARNDSTFARHARATSGSEVSKAQRTRRVAVEVRWKALSGGGLVICSNGG